MDGFEGFHSFSLIIKKFVQHFLGSGRIAFLDGEPAGTFGHSEDHERVHDGGNGFHPEHQTPIPFAPNTAEEEVGEEGNQDAEDNVKLVESH